MTTRFISNLSEIRRRARQHVLEGAVTAGYEADREKVIALLNEALATELVCVLRYKQHYFVARGIQAEPVAREFAEHAAEEQGHADRVDYRVGDFVALADVIEPADVVALDRVLCCYSDMSSLVARSAALAKRRYGVVYPRYNWFGRVAIALINIGKRVSGSPFRTYLHRTADVDAILADHGLVKRLHRTTLIWQLAVYERPTA